MAIRSAILALLVVLVVVPFASAKFHLECTMLPVEECAFAVSYDGYRCVLERQLSNDMHVCQKSNIKVGEDAPVEYIETDSCVKACGVSRMTIGFSTDEVYSNRFISKMCSWECREACLNLVDLYSNIIAGEGVTLAEFCGEQRRSMLMNRRMALSPM